MAAPPPDGRMGDSGVLIAGATPAGIQAALNLARLGRRVWVVDPRADLLPPGDRYDPPEFRWIEDLMIQAAYHPLIQILPETKVGRVDERDDRYQVELIRHGAWVRPDLCADCGQCLSVCPVELPAGGKPIFSIRAPHAAAIDKRKKAPCRTACPLEMNPQAYIALIARGRFEDAYREIIRTNPLAGICGRVCTHPCESACRRREVDQPLAICALKRFIADEALVHHWDALPEKASLPDGPKVAVVGSGPAGLTAAHDLARAGFQPTLIEADHRLGGLLHQGIASYRLPSEVVEREIEAVLALGVEKRLNCPVNSWPEVEKLKADGFEAVVLATGAARDLRMKIPGEDLDGVRGCVSFLAGLWKGEKVDGPRSVAVIGGGNAAIEACRAAVRTGVDSVHLLYRRTRDEMPADPHEVALAREEGVNLSFLTQPVAFEGEGGRLRRIRCLRMVLEAPDGSGRPRPVPVDGSDFYLEADMAVVSIGQEADPPFASGILNQTPRGAIEIGGDGQCAPGVFAAGDLVSGPSTVVEAMASGRRAARAVMAWFAPDRFEIAPGVPPSEEGEYDDIPRDLPLQERRPVPHRTADSRILDYHEVIGPYSAAEAMAEAARCLQCGGCCECFSCESACRLKAIDHQGTTVRESILVDRVLDPGEPESSVPAGRSLQAAAMTGRSIALDLLARTTRASWEPATVRKLSARTPKTGLFICSCQETLNKDMIAATARHFREQSDVAYVEVLLSACHPEEGRRIEAAVDEQELSSLVIASCTCCHLDFACESCTSQRIRLKDRLFRQSHFDPREVALVNIREAGFLPFKNDLQAGVAQAIRIVHSGLMQLTGPIQQPYPKREAFWGSVIILGATPAGLAAAAGLMNALRPVVLVDDRLPDNDLKIQMQRLGIEIARPAKIVGIEGRKGAFSLITEIEPEGADIDNGHINGIFSGGSILLAREEFLDLAYRRSPFSEIKNIKTKTALGTLETSVPGIYMASWPVDLPTGWEVSGKAAAGSALEGAYARIMPYGRWAAVVDESLCRGCGRCAEICQEGAVRLEESAGGTACSCISPALCAGCGACLAECPTGAIGLPEADQYQYKKVLDVILGRA